MPEAIIIGASRGIGNALVRAYAGAGWQVTATARDAAGADALTAIEGVTGHVADITDEASLAPLAQAPIDLLVVNAGVMTPEADLGAVGAAEWTRVMTTNALGPLLAARALAGSIRDGGSFVALSSEMGSIGGTAAAVITATACRRRR